MFRLWRSWGRGRAGHDAAGGGLPRGGGVPDRRPGPFGEAGAAGTKPKTPQDSGFCPGRPRPPIKSPTRPPADASAGPSGMPEADALTLVEAAAARLWTPEGRDALAYLHDERHLTPETIRAARLGWTPGATVPTREGDRGYRALGVVIPWLAGGRLVLAKIRQPDGRRPKYVEGFRDPGRLVCYPGPEMVRSGRPLVIVEGEFDALLLGQELAPFDVAVITLGSASSRPGPAILGRMLAAAPWFIATDSDEAGDRSASGWPARSRRLRPPEGKDWTEFHATGFNRIRYLWGGILGRGTTPWSDLAALALGTGPRRSDARHRHRAARPGPQAGGPASRRR